jgi:hypothetical protein
MNTALRTTAAALPQLIEQIDDRLRWLSAWT